MSLAFLVLLILTLALNGCSLSDEEAIARLGELLPRSLALEEAIYGRGMPTDGSVTLEEGQTGSVWCPLSPDAPFGGYAAFFSEMAQVYTVERAEAMLIVGFVGSTDVSPRYQEDEEGRLCADLTFSGYALGNGHDLSRAKVTGKTPYAVMIDLPYTAKSGREGVLSVRLVNVDSVWLLDTPTYYREEKN